MAAIPDPEPQLHHDHALYGREEEKPDTVRRGWAEVDPEMYDGVKFGERETGRVREAVDLESDPNDPNALLGNLLPSEGEEGEPRRIRMMRYIHESKPYKYFLIDHVKGTETAVAISAIAVSSLVLRRRHKKPKS